MALKAIDDRVYVIVSTAETGSINYNQIYETAPDTLRTNNSGSKTFVKWEGDNKVNYIGQIEKQGNKIEVLETKVDRLQFQLHRSDSTLAGAISKLSILDKLCILEAK